MPDVLPLKKGPKTLPDVFHLDAGIVVCSGRLKALLEELDPGLHQFIPIKVLTKDGQTAPGEHFILNVHHTLDTIVDELTKLTKSDAKLPGKTTRHYMSLRLNAMNPGDVTVAGAKLTSAHLWREKAYPTLYIMSDTLHSRLKQNGMRFLKAIKAATV